MKPCGSTEKTQERASEHGDQQEGRPDLDRESTDRGNEQRLRHRGGSNERSRTPVLRVPEGDGGEGSAEKVLQGMKAENVSDLARDTFL